MRNPTNAPWPTSRISRREGLALIARAAALAALAPAAVARAAAPPPPTAPTSQPYAATALPEPIRAALARQAAQIPPITIRWTAQSRSVSELEELARSIRTDRDARYERMLNDHRSYRVTFQDGKYRASHQEEPHDPLEVPPLHESAFDGEFTYGGTVAPPRDGVVQTMYLKTPLANYKKPSDDDSQYLSAEPLEQMGIRLPVRIKDLRAKAPVRSEILAMLEEGAKLIGVDEVDLDGRKVVRLRLLADDPERTSALRANLDQVRQELAGATTDAEINRVLADLKRQQQNPPKRLYVFYLDPALGFAIRRREEFFEPDIPISRTDLEAHEKLDDRDVFVLRRSLFQSYDRKPVPAGQVATPVQTRTMEVTQVSTAPKPPETFALAYNEPGTHVYVNDANERQTMLEVQEDGTLAPRQRRQRRRNATTTTTTK